MKKLLLTASFLGISYGAAEPSKSWLQPARIGSVGISTTLALKKYAPRQLTQEEVIENLSQGMSGEDKNWLIKAVAKVDPSKWTDGFVQIVNALSLGMDGWHKSYVISSVAKVDPSNYPIFIDTVNALSQGMHKAGKSSVISIVAKADPSNYKLFVDTANTLSVGMNGSDKSWVIYAVAKVAPSKWTDGFVQTVNTLSVGMNGQDKNWLIKAVAKVDPSKWTDGFVQTVNTLSVGMSGEDKSLVIEAVANVDPSSWTPQFIQTVNALSEGMNGEDKAWVIKVVAKVDSSKYNEFIQIVNVLSVGMNGENKARVISAVNLIRIEWWDPFVRYAAQRNFFRVVPAFAFAENLIIIQPQTAEQFEAIVNGLWRKYNARGAQVAPQGVAFDIHNYMKQKVTTASGQTTSLKDAIVERISILSKDLPIQEFEVSAALTVSTLPDAVFASENAVRAKQSLPPINEESVRWALDRVAEDETYAAVFNQVIAYVQSVGALEVWAKHFILNSVTAYDATSKGKSCPMGVRERILTSLMFVKNLDPAIEALFEQSESADTMNKLVSSWGHVIAVEDLKQAGIRSDMTAEEAKPLYEGLAKDRVKEVTGIDVDQSVDYESKAIRQLVDTVRLSVADFNERFETVFRAKLQALESGSASSVKEEDGFVAHAAAPAPRIGVGHVVQMLSMGMTPEQKAEVKRIVEGLPQEVDPMVFRQRVNEQTRNMSPDQRLDVIRQVAVEMPAVIVPLE